MNYDWVSTKTTFPRIEFKGLTQDKSVMVEVLQLPDCRYLASAYFDKNGKLLYWLSSDGTELYGKISHWHYLIPLPNTI